MDAWLHGQLSRSSLTSQWLTLRDRPELIPGKRQEPFTPLETVLCAAASLVVNHRRFGGSTSHLAEKPVPQLGRLFKRTNASVLAKMANVDGSRPNAARQDSLIAVQVLAKPEVLQAVYLDIFMTARALGLDSAALPDFLGLVNGIDLMWLGQDEIEPFLEVEIRSQLTEWGESQDGVTERRAEVAVRVGQHRFAHGVLSNYGRRCGFCGMKPPTSGRRSLLRASHIKPWAESAPAERHDIRNGVAACPTHDAAFDSGLITVNGGLAIHVSSAISSHFASDAALAQAFGRPPILERLALPEGAVEPGNSYLEWHRRHLWSR